MKNYLICYDISDTKRLYKIRKLAYSYALGGQKSAVFAPLCEVDIKELEAKFQKIIKPLDRINIIEVCENPLILGKSLPITCENGSIIL